jgi:hypothetical protein
MQVPPTVNAVTVTVVAVPFDLVPMYVVKPTKQEHVKMLKETFVSYGKVSGQPDAPAAAPDAAEEEPTLQMLSRWAMELNKLRTSMGNSGKIVAEMKVVREARDKYKCKLGQQLVVSVGDFLQYLSNKDNWSEESKKKTQEMLYDIKYEIWANKEATWLQEGENQWLSSQHLCYQDSVKKSRSVSSYCRLLKRKKEEIIGRLEAREVKLSGMVVRKKALKEDFWMRVGAVGSGGNGRLISCCLLSLFLFLLLFHFLLALMLSCCPTSVPVKEGPLSGR